MSKSEITSQPEGSAETTDAPSVEKPKDALDLSLLKYARHINSGRLFPVGTRKSPGNYLRETWERRHYIWREAQTKAKTQNAQHRLGMWWMVLKPLADALFFWVLFALILKTDRGMHNYTAYIIIGVLMFQYFSLALNGSTSVMRGSRGMIKAFSFPRLSIPLSFAVRNAMSHGPVMLVILVAIIAIPPHAFPHFSWLLLVPLFALCFLFNLGVTLVIARLGYVFPDLQQIMSVLSRFLMYGSAVIFPIELFINHPVVTSIVMANPIYQFLTLFREILIDGSVGSGLMWLGALLWTAGTLLIGFFVFWRAEEVYSRELN